MTDEVIRDLVLGHPTQIERMRNHVVDIIAQCAIMEAIFKRRHLND